MTNVRPRQASRLGDLGRTIYQIEPERRTLWGGPAHGIIGMHEWTFTTVEGSIRVETVESWSGEHVEADVEKMQAALYGALVAWLKHLRTAATTETPGTRD